MSAGRHVTSSLALSDEELMRQLAAGRQESLGRLHRRYAALIFRTAAYALDRGAAEEIVQDVFLAVWRNAGVFSPERGAFRSWVLRIAHFRILNELRRRRSLPRVQPDPDGLLLASLPDGGPEPEELAWRESLRPVVQSACKQLPRSQRQAVDLAFFKDLSHHEVAAELGIPLGTVKTRIRTGLQNLRGKLANFSSRELVAAQRGGRTVDRKLEREAC
jgi:RNA polymerase sigma-70 factor (ECF subfamily)